MNNVLKFTLLLLSIKSYACEIDEKKLKHRLASVRLRSEKKAFIAVMKEITPITSTPIPEPLSVRPDTSKLSKQEKKRLWNNRKSCNFRNRRKNLYNHLYSAYLKLSKQTRETVDSLVASKQAASIAAYHFKKSAVQPYPLTPPESLVSACPIVDVPDQDMSPLPPIAIQADINMYQEQDYVVPLTLEHLTVSCDADNILEDTIQYAQAQVPLSTVTPTLKKNLSDRRRSLFLDSFRKKACSSLHISPENIPSKQAYSFNEYDKNILAKLQERDLDEQTKIIKDIQLDYLQAYSNYLMSLNMMVSTQEAQKQFNNFLKNYGIMNRAPRNTIFPFLNELTATPSPSNDPIVIDLT